MGFGQDLAGSVILLCCFENMFGFSFGLPSRLQSATTSWKSWCKVNNHSTTVSTLDRQRLKYYNSKCIPDIVCKAYDVKLLLAWLAEVLSFVTPAHSPSLQLASLALFSICSMLHVWDHAGLVLTDLQALQTIHFGDKFFEAYGSAAASVVGTPWWTLFPCRPKLHKVQCQVVDRIRCGSRVNPRAMSCWADEGFVNPISRISQLTKTVSSGLQCLLRWNLYVLARWNLANWSVKF